MSRLLQEGPCSFVYRQKIYISRALIFVLVPFHSGGTGFWAGNRAVDENPAKDPDLVLKPAPGSALLFGGDVTHAGMPVSVGIRSVLVCSLSTITPASNPDRLHGLQAPPKVSANFKGTL